MGLSASSGYVLPSRHAPGSDASRLASKSVLRSFSAKSAARCLASAWMLSTVFAFMSLVASRFAVWKEIDVVSTHCGL